MANPLLAGLPELGRKSRIARYFARLFDASTRPVPVLAPVISATR